MLCFPRIGADPREVALFAAKRIPIRAGRADQAENRNPVGATIFRIPLNRKMSRVALY
jgi:hypothetical protein